MAIALAVAVLAGVLWWRDHPKPGPSVADLHLTGTLVYAAAARPETNERLFVLDLETGRVRRGPLVRPVTDLVASKAGPGWLGVLAGGYGYVLEGERVNDPPVLLASGDLVSWTPGADGLVTHVYGRSANADCPTSTISQTDVRAGGVQTLYEAPECSGVISIGSDQAGAVYVTLGVIAAGSAVYQLGYQRLHLLLPGYGMLSVSPVGDMIVEPQVALAGRGLVPQIGAALYWRGLRGPVPIGSSSGHLVVERVLTWAPDGAFAVVLGSMGGARSVWIVRAGGGAGRRLPTRIGPLLDPAPVLPKGAVGPPDATVAADGSVYFTAEGRLFVYRNGHRNRIPLPADMPPPAGPLAWLAAPS